MTFRLKRQHCLRDVVTDAGAPTFAWHTTLPLKPYSPHPEYAKVTSFWERVINSLDIHDIVVLPPGPRTRDDDFAAKGLRMDRNHVNLARRQWAQFLDIGGLEPPRRAFYGRGIAILAGEAPHLVPALVAVQMIRKAGCLLPIELWFPTDEVITGPLVDKLRGLGAHVCTFFAPSSLGKVRLRLSPVILFSKCVTAFLGYFHPGYVYFV